MTSRRIAVNIICTKWVNFCITRTREASARRTCQKGGIDNKEASAVRRRWQQGVGKDALAGRGWQRGMSREDTLARRRW